MQVAGRIGRGLIRMVAHKIFLGTKMTMIRRMTGTINALVVQWSLKKYLFDMLLTIYL